MRHGIGHGRRGPPGMGCDSPAVAGSVARVEVGTSRQWTEATPRVAALRSETGRRFPRRSRRICARDRWRRGGSPRGAARVLRDTPVERRRQADAGLRGKGGAHRADRRCSDAERLARGLDQLLESLAHADQLDPLDVEGILALRSISERCAERIGEAARILEAQNEVFYAEGARARSQRRPSKRNAPPLRFRRAPGIGAPLISLAR